jgi:hypothetical protein
MRNLPSTPARKCVIGLCVFLPVLVFGQAGAHSTPPANATLRPIVVSDPAQPDPPTYELSLKWDDRSTNLLTTPLKNDLDKPLKVIGVQATRGIFITDFPGTIGAKKTDNISFIYSAADNTDGDTDVIRVLTDDGIKEIRVKIVRDQAANFDVKELLWTTGGPADTKIATITLTPGTAIPQKVRVTGGHQALLEAVNATTWRVKITPASTAKSGQFAVFVDFDKALPGKSSVILGVIQPKD